MLIDMLNLKNCDNLAYLLGIDKDGNVNADESYMKSLLYDLNDCLPDLTEMFTDDHETVMRSVHAMIMCSQCFQKCLDELSGR